MNVLGSFFIGDPQNMRVRGSSTSPPMSPNSPGLFGPPQATPHEQTQTRTPLSPEMALELRIRWLETLVKGKNLATTINGTNVSEPTREEPSPSVTIARQVEDIQSRLETVVEQNETLKLFLQYYKTYQTYLTPSFALNNIGGPKQPDALAPSEFQTLLKDMEPEIKDAERDLREIDELEKRGATAAGNLGVHEELQQRLDALVEAHNVDTQAVAAIEERITKLLERYTYKTDTLSELFVEWNDVLTAAEEKITALERVKEERRKLGYD